PLVGVVKKHAVAMAVDDLVLDVAFQVAHAGYGNGHLHARVGGSDPKRGRAAAGDAGDADLVGIHVGAGTEIIDGADAVPGLDAGRRVADRMPPEAVLEL